MNKMNGINRNILILGLVSLFTDISTEMVYPLIPLYLTAVIGAGPAVLGIIEGCAECLASVLKLFSGQIADHWHQKKPLAICGYGLSAVGKLLFVLASNWTGIFVARMGDRFGKGIRTAPRDALIADSANATARGRAFGIHRAMDTAGAVIGIALAWLLFGCGAESYSGIFWLAVIPAVAGVTLLFTVREPVSSVPAPLRRFIGWRQLDGRLKLYIIITFIFTLGNSSNMFLLLRAGALGFSARSVILLYLLMNIAYFISVYPAGRWSDHCGRRNILVLGYLLYAFTYAGFALFEGTAATAGLFALYGLYNGCTDGVEKALLADLAPSGKQASVYGLQALIAGVTLLPASVLAGWLWMYFGAAAPFWFGSGMAVVAAMLLLGIRI